MYGMESPGHKWEDSRCQRRGTSRQHRGPLTRPGSLPWGAKSPGPGAPSAITDARSGGPLPGLLRIPEGWPLLPRAEVPKRR